eukprot:gnl/TRDRNA2_/TRDRNA2_172087_c0_seq6.p1 gnl/TRDRNA2_/TRDRNA2_172087_c0~~gnl/TRDRNA2_/TRDRNA2_172087_c0_seq6.p1  ORF type:complete len:234 (-),score=60.06 gnl/TRDRNA2_/TRDRNA2_172087_c0_seq6:249-875(-)
MKAALAPVIALLLLNTSTAELSCLSGSDDQSCSATAMESASGSALLQKTRMAHTTVLAREEETEELEQVPTLAFRKCRRACKLGEKGNCWPEDLKQELLSWHGARDKFRDCKVGCGGVPGKAMNKEARKCFKSKCPEAKKELKAAKKSFKVVKQRPDWLSKKDAAKTCSEEKCDPDCEKQFPKYDELLIALDDDEADIEDEDEGGEAA